MSQDVARGGFVKTKNVGKRRNFNDGVDPINASLASRETIEKYLGGSSSVGHLSHDKASSSLRNTGRGKSRKDKKVEAQVARSEKKRVEAAVRAAEAEILNTEEGGFIEVENEMERTYKLKQDDVRPHLDTQVSAVPLCPCTRV